MRTSRSTDGKQKFRRYMQEKLAITVLVIMLALFALVMVLYNIVRDRGEEYNQIVLGHQDYESRTIPFRRGSITDRNGTYLAVSEKVYNLILDPKQILDTEENYYYLEATLDALNACFGYDKEELRSLIEERGDAQYVIYARQLPAEEKENFETYAQEKNAEFIALPTEEGGNQRVAGVWFEEEYKRMYPYNETACHVIGFTLRDGLASGGVEQYYNDTLNGINGREYGYLNSDANLERTIKPPRNGQTLELTIDVNIQKTVEKYLDEWQAGIGSNVAAAIVMDPNTGEILAMDSSSRYDLNDPYNLDGYYTEEEQAAMDADAQAQAWYGIWRNFCVSDTYEPGSPQKPFTVAGALEEGVISGNESFECTGVMEVGGWPIHCVARLGHGPTTVTQGLMKSCNVVMMRIAQMEGSELFTKYQHIFGFGSRTGIDLPGEAEGIVYSPEKMDAASLATNAFGQNFNCTMVQMAAAFCSVINGGSYYEPHVVREILNDQGAVVEEISPRLVRETVSESTSAYIRDALYQTVSGDGGTAGAAAVPGYEIGGKTGTAQKQPREEKNYLVSFIGFAPAYDPQVVTYVVLDTPHLPGEEQAHSSFASEIFGKIMAEILPYMNVFPEGDGLDPVSEELAGQEEGIISPEQEETEEGAQDGDETQADGGDAGTPEETWAVYDEEFIDSCGEDYNFPDTMGGGAPPSTAETQEGGTEQGEEESRADAGAQGSRESRADAGAQETGAE